MKIWKTALSLVLCIVMATSVLVGCGGDTAEPAPAPAAEEPAAAPEPAPAAEAPAAEAPAVEVPADAEPVTLRFSWWGTPPRHQATLAVIDAFTAIYPHITIIPEYGAQDGYNDKKTVEFSNGTAPDMFQIETGSGFEYTRMGVLYNMSELNNISFDKFDPAFLEANGQFGTGSQYCIPTGAAGTSLVVNKTLADAAGVDLEAQMEWEDLFALGAKVQEYDSNTYLLSANTTTGVAFFIRAYSRQLLGEAMINSDEKKLVLSEAQFEEIFDLISRLYAEKVCAPMSLKASYDNNDMEDPNWIGGKYVASCGYTSNIEALANNLKDANPDAVVIPGSLPLHPNRQSDGWTNNCPQFMGISADTPYPEECALFFDFFFNSEVAAGILGTVRSVPPTAFAQALLQEREIGNPLVIEATNKSLTYQGFDDSGLTTNDTVNQILKDLYEAVAYGTMSASEAASEAVSQINAYLATA